MYGYGYGDGPWMHGGWMVGGGAMMLLWIVVIGMAVGLAIHLMRRPGDGVRGKTAIDILKERYARGEIEKEEFDRRKRDLE